MQKIYIAKLNKNDRYIKNILLKELKILVFKNKGIFKAEYLNTINTNTSKQNILNIFQLNTNIKDIKKIIEIIDDILNLFSLTHKVIIENDEVIYSTFFSKLSVSLFINQIELSKKIQNSLKNTSYEAKKLFKELKQLKEDSFIVGGYIRDVLNNKQNKDIDICSNIPYDKLSFYFKKNWNIKETGKHFLVLNLISKNTNESFEIAEFRKDKDMKKGIPGTIFDDAARRDFTVNALYFDIKRNILVDPNGQGILDIQNNTLCFIGNAKDRIIEDPLRVFRFYRFIDKGFIPNKNSLKTIRTYFEFAINSTSSSRIMKEIEKIVKL